jgi:hypothetical protein
LHTAQETRDELTSDPIVDRTRFLWNQQRYLLENIKLADTKAGFIMTISAAVLSASLSPGGRLSFHLTKLSTPRSYVGTILFILGLTGLIASTLFSAWSIKPRLRSSVAPSPVSWVNIARYKGVHHFLQANRAMTEETAADLLCEQVYFMSRICVQKHRLISTSILLALIGGFLLAAAIAIR